MLEAFLVRTKVDIYGVVNNFCEALTLIAKERGYSIKLGIELEKLSNNKKK